MRKVILLFILITSVLGAWADGNVTFTASAPDVVVSGDQFRLTYTVNTHKVRDFRAPNIKGFDVLMGPSRSQQSSTQIINGNVTSTSSITFTYILMADKEGTYTIPGATIVADGQNKTSNSVQIKVLPPDQTNGVGGGNNSGGRTSSRSQVAGSKITNQDLFITATASKTTVYEQEAILLTYKVYTLVNLRQLYGKMPDLKNFHTSPASGISFSMMRASRNGVAVSFFPHRRRTGHWIFGKTALRSSLTTFTIILRMIPVNAL